MENKIKELIINSLTEMSDSNFDITKKCSLINPSTGQVYENNNIIRETDIVNSKRLILY